MVDAFGPGRGNVALRAPDLLLLPVHDKLLCRIRPFSFCLPSVVGAGGADECNTALTLTLHQQFGINISRIYELLGWRQILCDKLLLDRFRALRLVHGGRSRVDMGNEVRRFVVTTLTKVNHITRPEGSVATGKRASVS